MAGLLLDKSRPPLCEARVTEIKRGPGTGPLVAEFGFNHPLKEQNPDLSVLRIRQFAIKCI